MLGGKIGLLIISAQQGYITKLPKYEMSIYVSNRTVCEYRNYKYVVLINILRRPVRNKWGFDKIGILMWVQWYVITFTKCNSFVTVDIAFQFNSDGQVIQTPFVDFCNFAFTQLVKIIEPPYRFEIKTLNTKCRWHIFVPTFIRRSKLTNQRLEFFRAF